MAQVVGAGYSMSKETGDIATVVKLMRVAMLLPVIMFAVMFMRATGKAGDGPRPPLLPWFAVAFAAAGGAQQHGLAAQGRDGDRQRRLGLVSGGGHRRHRHEDAAHANSSP